jgi:hypothetical protein
MDTNLADVFYWVTSALATVAAFGGGDSCVLSAKANIQDALVGLDYKF